MDVRRSEPGNIFFFKRTELTSIRICPGTLRSECFVWFVLYHSEQKFWRTPSKSSLFHMAWQLKCLFCGGVTLFLCFICEDAFSCCVNFWGAWLWTWSVKKFFTHALGIFKHQSQTLLLTQTVYQEWESHAAEICSQILITRYKSEKYTIAVLWRDF